MKLRGVRLFLSVFVATVVFLSWAQGQQSGGGLQEKLAAVKQSAAANKEALSHYEWTATTTISLNGEVKKTTQEFCRYGADGSIQKIPVASPNETPQERHGRFGRVKEKVVEKKKDEMEQYMEDTKNLIGMYVPPDPTRMQQAFQAGKVSINPNPASGQSELIFKDYAVPGDSMSLTMNGSTKKLSNLNVNTYLNQLSDVVTLAVQFDSLPDGTSYPGQTVLVAQAKKIQVMTTNAAYVKLAQ